MPFKLGSGTACVFVLGEAVLTAQYGSVNVPISSTFNSSLGGGSLSTAAHALSYPSELLYIGVAPRAQVVITPPSFTQINSNALSALTNSNVLAAGSSSMSFQYKQIVYVSMTKETIGAIDLAYTPPTGSPILRGAGPSYTFDPIVTQPLPHHFGVTLAFPIDDSDFTNGPTCSTGNGGACVPGMTQRGVNWSIQVIPYWTSPGGTQLGLFFQHEFNPNVTPVIFSASQLFGRHFSLGVAYGGFNYSGSSTGPLTGLLQGSTTTYPRLLSISVSYLFGRSDLPAALQP